MLEVPVWVSAHFHFLDLRRQEKLGGGGGGGGMENHGENKLIVLFRLPCWIPGRGGSWRSDAEGGGAVRCSGRGKE